MSLKIQNSRHLLKRTKTALQIPTIPSLSSIHTDGTWNTNDIYPGELFLNMEDKKLYVGVEDSLGVTDVVLLNPWTSGTGSCIQDLYVTNIYGCSPITFHDSIQHVGGTASGALSTAIGDSNTASGDGSFSGGLDCISSGSYSFTFGNACLANIDYAVAFGNSTIASGSNSFAAGDSTTASGSSSAAFGQGTVADAGSSLAIGTWNTTGLTTGTFVVGNGTSNVTRSDLFKAEPSTSSIFMSLPAYQDDAAAGVAGLTTGQLYQTTGTGAAPLNAAGIVMIKQ